MTIRRMVVDRDFIASAYAACDIPTIEEASAYAATLLKMSPAEFAEAIQHPRHNRLWDIYRTAKTRGRS